GPNSLTQCPQCRKRVGRTSEFCWNCGAEIAAEKPPRLKGDFWVRDEREFAVRVEPEDVKGLTKRQIGIEPGTVGVIEKSGKIIKEIDHGIHTLDSLFKITAATSVILVSANELVLRPRFAGDAQSDAESDGLPLSPLRDTNGAELEITLQIALQVKDYEAFVRKHFEGHRRRVTVGMLEDNIRHELYDVVRSLVVTKSMEDMYGNLEFRNFLEDNLRAAMTVTLDRAGLDLVQLSFVDFGGDHFEELMRDRGEVYMGNHGADHLAEMQAIRWRISELEDKDELHKYTSAKELKDKIEELNAQYEIKSVMRDVDRLETIEQAMHEMEIKRKLRSYEIEDIETERGRQVADEERAYMMTVQRAEDEFKVERRKYLIIARQEEGRTQADFVREQEKLDNQQTIEESWKLSEHRRRDQRADAVQRYDLLIQEATATATKQIEELRGETAKHELEHRKREDQVKILGQIQAQEREQLELMHRLDMEKRRLDVDYKRFEKDKEAEVELARIRANVDIAESSALKDAAVSDAVVRQMQERLADQKQATESVRQDSDKRSGDLKDIAEVLTKNQAQPTVVVAGPGGGQVIGGAQSGAPAPPHQTPCPKCQRPVPLDANFCPWCQHDMKS
ncbi:MAG: hypothetical protein JXR94_00625, partial [Candidatus Hydrogenedentes bacterium]|nr:hypothetical protein [Candidatus Hydrogenedentota bacterium]